jgi:hypothetical protein
MYPSLSPLETQLRDNSDNLDDLYSTLFLLTNIWFDGREIFPHLNILHWRAVTVATKKCSPCSAELISTAYQPWNSVFLSQQISHSRLISQKKQSAEQDRYRHNSKSWLRARGESCSDNSVFRLESEWT